MFDDQMVQDFMNGFYGYGDYRAKYWFVGMEEHSGELERGIARRLDAWDKRGRKELEDVVDYHHEIGITKHFDERAVLQPTWNKIIRVLLSIEGQKPTTAQVRDYQRSRLARENGDSCLVELLPLPSPKANVWHYATYSTLDFLKCREDYVEYIRPQRITHLKSRIEEYQPKAVVFYGMSCEPAWNEIADVTFHPSKPKGVKVADNGKTLFIITKHPTTIGATNKDFHAIGRMIASAKR